MGGHQSQPQPFGHSSILNFDRRGSRRRGSGLVISAGMMAEPLRGSDLPLERRMIPSSRLSRRSPRPFADGRNSAAWRRVPGRAPGVSRRRARLQTAVAGQSVLRWRARSPSPRVGAAEGAPAPCDRADDRASAGPAHRSSSPAAGRETQARTAGRVGNAVPALLRRRQATGRSPATTPLLTAGLRGSALSGQCPGRPGDVGEGGSPLPTSPGPARACAWTGNSSRRQLR